MTSAVVARKVADLRAHVARVRALLPPTAEAFAAHRTEAEALMLNLMIAIQSTTDLAMHVVADKGLGVPSDARAAFETLVRDGLLDADVARRLGAAVAVRNRIAHQYGTLDLALVHAAARDGLADLEGMASAVASAYGI